MSERASVGLAEWNYRVAIPTTNGTLTMAGVDDF
jgi:hypothetical protein